VVNVTSINRRLGLSQARLIAGVGFLGWEQSAPSSPPANKFGEALSSPAGSGVHPQKKSVLVQFWDYKNHQFCIIVGRDSFWPWWAQIVAEAQDGVQPP